MFRAGIAEALVTSLIESLWDSYVEAQAAQEHVDSLIALAGQHPAGSVPSVRAPRTVRNFNNQTEGSEVIA